MPDPLRLRRSRRADAGLPPAGDRLRRHTRRRSAERAARDDRHAASRSCRFVRIPARRHSDAGRAGCARRALQDRDCARAADGPIARIDPHRADAARPRLPQQRRIRAGSYHQDGRGGLPEGGLPHRGRRVGLSARPPVRIRSRIRGVRGPPPARERSSSNAVRRASGGRQHGRGAQVALDGCRRAISTLVPLAALLRSARAVRAAGRHRGALPVLAVRR